MGPFGSNTLVMFANTAACALLLLAAVVNFAVSLRLAWQNSSEPKPLRSADPGSAPIAPHAPVASVAPVASTVLTAPQARRAVVSAPAWLAASLLALAALAALRPGLQWTAAAFEQGSHWLLRSPLPSSLALALLGTWVWCSARHLMHLGNKPATGAAKLLPLQAAAAAALPWLWGGWANSSQGFGLIGPLWACVAFLLAQGLAYTTWLRPGRRALGSPYPTCLWMALCTALWLALSALPAAWLNSITVRGLGHALPFLVALLALRLAWANGARSEQISSYANSTLVEQRVRELTEDIEARHRKLADLKVQQVTERERKRIAADLHDDLGAKLLTIVHTSESDRISSLAREALEEMRLSVRGLTGRPVALSDAMGDWRAETVARLSQAGIGSQWQAPEDLPQTLSSRAYVQTTRILREATSNIIKHSGAAQCSVQVDIADGDFQLIIQDDGNGISQEIDARLDRGHGLASMKNRAKQLHGQCLIESGAGYGTVIRLTLPLELALGPA